MRKAYLFLLVVLIVLVCVGCSPTVEKGTNVGFLKISLPIKDNEGSRVLTNAQASNVADVYGVFIWNSESNYSVYTEISPSVDYISLPVGSYKVVALAGKLKNDAAYLCGSGSADSVAIEEDKVTVVNIALKVPSLEVEYLAEGKTLYTSEKASLFSMRFDSNNPYIYMWTVGYNYGLSGGTEKNTSSLGVNGKLYTHEKELPVEPGTYKYGYAGSLYNKLYVIDYLNKKENEGLSFSKELSVYANGKRDWKLGPVGVFEYDKLFECHEFEVVKRPTALSISLSWDKD